MTNDRDIIIDIREDTIKFAVQQFESFLPRDDYKELLELVLVFLGGDPPRAIFFMAHGTIHHAH